MAMRTTFGFLSLQVFLSTILSLPVAAAEAGRIYLGSGAKAGEITDTSAIIHVRLTSVPEQNSEQLIPGRPGQARIALGLGEKLGETLDLPPTTEWRDAEAAI